ncbi:acetyl-CoA decarbonylase/synthase complex subunit delta [Lachnospiraceae bacterium CLA-AA-H215]|uniref:Acetyl-CoA decarbonylase/synthase complex subunit delta n=1 Tax=Hominifimenecus microfluidus TaxID=2885348 RepID=A0AAE3EC39_9FIRM|nr:acetyl-CoA decarbonylase/synthase complex subunit delta [Hominifimenecus microfluidus]MCC2231618.1 acetyl-CoA decarbonylase/synthase complex subunit delta [Hominifimenecus microfluidus]
MPFKKTPQTFSAAIKAVEIGTGDKAITIGGENVLPLYSFDAEIANAPKIGVEILDTGFENAPAGLKAFYEGCTSMADMAKKAATIEGASFICLHFEGADPNGADRSVDECVADAKAVAEAVDLPIVIMGCKNNEKDSDLFNKCSEALQGKNILVLAAKEETYKAVGASAGLAYGQKVGAESSVDINLAKQLNVLLTQLGVKQDSIVMHVGTAAAGYGFEYVVSTMERIRLAALGQNDNTLQMPVMTPVASEAWNVKEAIASEADMPEWGDVETRGIDMEVVTASAVLAAGTNAVILRHPQSIATVSKLINALM